MAERPPQEQEPFLLPTVVLNKKDAKPRRDAAGDPATPPAGAAAAAAPEDWRFFGMIYWRGVDRNGRPPGPLSPGGPGGCIHMLKDNDLSSDWSGKVLVFMGTLLLDWSWRRGHGAAYGGPPLVDFALVPSLDALYLMVHRWLRVALHRAAPSVYTASGRDRTLDRHPAAVCVIDGVTTRILEYLGVCKITASTQTSNDACIGFMAYLARTLGVLENPAARLRPRNDAGLTAAQRPASVVPSEDCPAGGGRVFRIPYAAEWWAEVGADPGKDDAAVVRQLRKTREYQIWALETLRAHGVPTPREERWAEVFALPADAAAPVEYGKEEQRKRKCLEASVNLIGVGLRRPAEGSQDGLVMEGWVKPFKRDVDLFFTTDQLREAVAQIHRAFKATEPTYDEDGAVMYYRGKFPPRKKPEDGQKIIEEYLKGSIAKQTFTAKRREYLDALAAAAEGDDAAARKLPLPPANGSFGGTSSTGTSSTPPDPPPMKPKPRTAHHSMNSMNHIAKTPPNPPLAAARPRLASPGGGHSSNPAPLHLNRDVPAVLARLTATYGDALVGAVLTGHVDIVRHLVQDCGVPVNGRYADNWTPLLYAAGGGHAQVVEYLLAAGADPSVAAADGTTAAALAQRKNYRTVHQLLVGFAKTAPRGHAGGAPPAVGCVLGRQPAGAAPAPPPGVSLCVYGSGGVGKSTVLNSLLGAARFASGVLYTDGTVTQRHDVAACEAYGCALVDTPGVHPRNAEEITRVMRGCEWCKVLFVVRVQSGRVPHDDMQAVRGVLRGFNQPVRYSVVVNKVGQRMLTDFERVPNMRRKFEQRFCDSLQGRDQPRGGAVQAPTSFIYLQHSAALDDMDNAVPPPPTPAFAALLQQLGVNRIDAGAVYGLRTPQRREGKQRRAAPPPPPVAHPPATPPQPPVSLWVDVKPGAEQPVSGESSPFGVGEGTPLSKSTASTASRSPPALETGDAPLLPHAASGGAGVWEGSPGGAYFDHAALGKLLNKLKEDPSPPSP
eukprot:TRINITY_DN1266_c0_g2_i1.p1 TRINITY_DN1266_c0_g2~~TRINITY_DN1266_c0_g2_i1.p1  ORF type:complete len:1134 (+),score=375.96 TRINITY_DN1266_c0_g2_i1:392-3403(+)